MDIRIDEIFKEEIGDTKSKLEKEHPLSLLFGGTKYSAVEMRDNWDSGVKYGIEIGLRKATLEGHRMELYQNITEDRQKEFLDKFYALCGEYNCAITYHPQSGMCPIDLDRR